MNLTTLHTKIDTVLRLLGKSDNRLSHVERLLERKECIDDASEAEQERGEDAPTSGTGQKAAMPSPWKKRFADGYRTLERIGILAVIVSTVVTTFGWRDQRENFRYEHRAWLKVDFKLLQAPITIGENISNIGKSPIIRSETRSWIEILKNNQVPSLDPRPIPNLSQFHLLYPTDSYTFPIWRYSKDKLVVPITDDERNSLHAGTSYVAVYGVTTYTDQFGEHWGKFCMWTSAFAIQPNDPNIQYSAGPCATFNATGDGKFDDKSWPHQ